MEIEMVMKETRRIVFALTSQHIRFYGTETALNGMNIYTRLESSNPRSGASENGTKKIKVM